MNRITRHILLPALLPVGFFAAAALPVTLLGCRTRGLVAALLALIAALLGVVAAGMAVVGKIRGDPNSPWWIVTAFVLAIPGAYIVLFAT